MLKDDLRQYVKARKFAALDTQHQKLFENFQEFIKYKLDYYASINKLDFQRIPLQYWDYVVFLPIQSQLEEQGIFLVAETDGVSRLDETTTYYVRVAP